MTRSFVDTNLFVYVLDDEDPGKQAMAKALVRGLVAANDAVISTQILQELYVTLRSRFAKSMTAADAAVIVRDYAELPVVQVDAPIIVAAMARVEAASISFWDALVVEAALIAGATRLLTEVLQHGQIFAGRLRVENPFHSG